MLVYKRTYKIITNKKKIEASLQTHVLQRKVRTILL